MILRKRIRFYGSVQGVGFRYRARRASELYECSGWVKNEWDGTVLMEIQGEEASIDQVIISIESGTYVRISKMEVESMPLDETEKGFRSR